MICVQTKYGSWSRGVLGKDPAHRGHYRSECRSRPSASWAWAITDSAASPCESPPPFWISNAVSFQAISGM